MNFKANKKLIFFIITLIVILGINRSVYANEKINVDLKKCVDGDTAVFILNDQEIKVRFLAVDTPESVHPTKHNSEDGINASIYTCEKLTNASNIQIEYDQKSNMTDKYNRYLAWIWVDDFLLQKDLIKNGYAEVKYIYGKYLYLDELYNEENLAKSKNIGIWKDSILHTVTFNDSMNKKVVYIKDSSTVNFYIPEKKGYKFIGWYINEDLFDENTKITSNIYLNAKFKKDYEYFSVLVILILLYIAYKTNNKKVVKQLNKIYKEKLKNIN